MEHAHIGVWLTTLHMALIPHEPIQGSLHFWLIHANRLEHSELLIHSGRQFGGDPMNSGKQEHDGFSLITSHFAFGPHGDGKHGLIGISGFVADISNKKIWFIQYWLFFENKSV